MIVLTKIDEVDDTHYNFVRCPQCGTRLCDKPIQAKASAIKIAGKEFARLSHILLQCNRCKSKYLVSIDEEK